MCANLVRGVLSAGGGGVDDDFVNRLLTIPGCPSLFQGLLTNCDAIIGTTVVS